MNEHSDYELFCNQIYIHTNSTFSVTQNKKNFFSIRVIDRYLETSNQIRFEVIIVS